MVTKRLTISRPLRPRITQVAVHDYQLFCENTFGPEHECATPNGGCCECCVEREAAWWRLYSRFHLRPWFEPLPIIFPDDVENDQKWASCLEQALQHVYATDKSLLVRQAGHSY